MRKMLACGSLVAFVLGLPAAATGQEARPWLTPPVDGAVVSHFDAPVRRWGSGHRGVDFAAVPGTAVRAAAPGRVSFAGSVAGVLAVTIDHGAYETTYSALSAVEVSEGTYVERGHWIGSTGEAHPGRGSGLHLGVKVGDAYADPMSYLGPLDASEAIHLAPVLDRGIEEVPDLLHPLPLNVGDHHRDCAERRSVESATVAPNDNVVVVVNGLGSRTDGPTDSDLYRHAVELLRYPPERVYLFSYAGTAGPRLHEPYSPSATFGDLKDSAERLEDLLRAIGRRHPGADVDLLAHSQGGLVSRLFLQELATSWTRGMPRVDHLVTLATPHTGAPAARIPARMDATAVGSLLNDALSALARDTGVLPDPRAEAVTQLAPSSAVLGLLAREDVAWGTRVLSLSVPDDVAVPAHRARLRHEQNLTLPPAGGFAHRRIVRSERAASVAHDFLRDAAPSCPGGWDSWGPRLGKLVEALEDRVW